MLLPPWKNGLGRLAAGVGIDFFHDHPIFGISGWCWCSRAACRENACGVQCIGGFSMVTCFLINPGFSHQCHCIELGKHWFRGIDEASSATRLPLTVAWGRSCLSRNCFKIWRFSSDLIRTQVLNLKLPVELRRGLYSCLCCTAPAWQPCW